MACGSRRSLWGWGERERCLLALLALVPAAALAVRPADRPAPTPIEPALVLDPNTAPAGALLALPRVGPVLAGRIVAGRPYRSLDDLDARAVQAVDDAAHLVLGEAMRHRVTAVAERGVGDPDPGRGGLVDGGGHAFTFLRASCSPVRAAAAVMMSRLPE